ncbi:MAG TPA: hypothetical protein VFJ14_14515 [Nocardioidaceae bacterium]|nr:hypothetical protein [Nocardioidaceae bacterium]
MEQVTREIRVGRVGAFKAQGIVGLWLGRWQLDYRSDGWLPLSVRRGRRGGWRVLRLGRFGRVTFAPLLEVGRP